MLPAHRLTAWLRPVLTLLGAVGLLSLAACGGGSGAPNNPYAASPGSPPALSVIPANGIAYSGFPFTITIVSGTGPFTVASNNPTTVPVPATVTGASIVLLPGDVATDTSVSITVRDYYGQTQTVALIVKPALLLPNAITITGSPGCNNGGQLCSGSTGTASVTVTGPGGVGLSGRQVRFDVVQGSYAIQSTNPAAPLVSTLTVVTDQNGRAIVGLAVPPGTLSQLGVLRATEVASGSQVVGQFTIAQQVAGTSVLSAIPSDTTKITGPYKGVCSSSVRVSFYLFGGTPPYRVSPSFPGAVTLVGSPVTAQGGNFDIITNGSCFTGLTFAVVDANGLTLTSPPRVDNVEGTAAAPGAVVPLVVSPGSYGSASSPVNCSGATFAFTITGTPSFFAVANTLAVVNTAGLATSPGNLLVSSLPAAQATTVTIGDSSSPQQLSSVQIFCQ